MSVEIVQRENPVLRKVSKEVPLDEIASKKIAKIIADMKVAVDSCDDGVAIAAPQIGKSLRIFVVSPKALISPDDEKFEEKIKNLSHLVFINPKIVKLSSKTTYLDEGCLSVRGTFGKIRRSEKATIEGYDERGVKVTRGASGLLAEIFQHETDHLNGIIFTDKAAELYQLANEKECKKES